jgi:hypothetical protein
MSEIVNINGTKYSDEDFNDEQRYLLNQIRSCKAKAAQLTFDLDQIKVAEQAFSQGFLVSVEASKDEEKNAEEVKSEQVKSEEVETG